MKKELKIDYDEYVRDQKTIEKLTQALDKIKTAKNIVVLDYDNVEYGHDRIFGRDYIRIPKIEGDGIGAYEHYKEVFDKDKERIEEVYNDFREQVILKQRAYKNYMSDLENLKSEAKPWKIAFVMLALIFIACILWRLIL
jgi:hypothetical protein